MTKANNISDIWKSTSALESDILQALNLSEKLQDHENKSPHKPPFEINYLLKVDCPERHTSWIIRHIFAYKYKGVHPFLVSFVETFLQGKGFNKEWIDKPIIDKDHEYKEIDISIREDKKYAIIIENKLKGAKFQLNQLARYIAKMREEGYKDEQIFVVILPKENISNEQINKSVWKLPEDWKSRSQNRKCRIDDNTCKCDYEDYKQTDDCEKCENLRDIFKDSVKIIHSKLSEWLYKCVVNETTVVPTKELQKQYVVTSAVLQFVDFLNYLYKTRESDKFKMDIQDSLSKELKLNELSIDEQLLRVVDKIKDARDLVNRLRSLHHSKIEDYLKDMHTNYPDLSFINDINENYENYEKEEHYFHCDLNKIKVIVGVNKRRHFCQIETVDGTKIPEDIQNNNVISWELNDPENESNRIWKFDSYEESLSRFKRVLDEILKLKNNKKST